MSVWDRGDFTGSTARPHGDDSPWASGRGVPSGGRRLSASERRAMRQRREARSGSFQDAAPASNGAPGGSSRPVPKMPKRRPDTRVRSPLVTLTGTLLIVGLTVLAFAGGRLFGRVAQPTPTVVAQVDATIAAPAAAKPAPTADATSLSNAGAPVEPPPEATQIPLPASFKRAPVVCLDPGHGGSDRGFTRFLDDGSPSMEEAGLTLEQGLDLADRLRRRGYTVVLTRETDTAVNEQGKDVNGDGRTAAHDPPRSDKNKVLDEIQARINICNKAKADLLVSMHINGYSTGKPRGYETWFTRERPFGDRNAVFATLAYAHLKEQLGKIGYVLPAEDERGVLPDSTADVQKEHSLYNHFIITGPEIPGVIVPSKMPGAIVEALFVSNDGDAAVLGSPEGTNAIVTAYENAIVEYFERYPPGS